MAHKKTLKGIIQKSGKVRWDEAKQDLGPDALLDQCSAVVSDQQFVVTHTGEQGGNNLLFEEVLRRQPRLSRKGRVSGALLISLISFLTRAWEETFSTPPPAFSCEGVFLSPGVLRG